MSNPAIDWEKLYRDRAERLRKLIELKAPKYVVYMAAKTLLLTEFHNSTRRMVWRWFVRRVRLELASVRSDWGILRLRWQGWARECAIDIYFGDSPEHHTKHNCGCNEDWKKFCAERGKSA